MTARKKWTPIEGTSNVLATREKKKWQIALRRYVLENQPSSRYAPYFGLPVELFREWIGGQFHDGLGWENFGTHWQLEHVLPSQYFDLEEEADRRLCWNFINIRVEKTGESNSFQPGVLGAVPYFEALFAETGNRTCALLLEKIRQVMQTTGNWNTQASFLKNRKVEIEHLSGFSEDEFLRINQGESVESIVKEREILKKFGS